MAAELEAGGDFAQLAEQYTQGQENPTIYTDLAVPGTQLSSLYGEWLQDSARQSGDVTVAESSTSGGYFVVQFVDRYLLTSDTVDLRHILIKAEVDEDADAPTDEQMAAAKEKVEQLLAAWQSGEATEDSFATLANENSDDTGSNTNGGFYNAYKGQMIPNFDQLDLRLRPQERRCGHRGERHRRLSGLSPDLLYRHQRALLEAAGPPPR